MFRSSIKNYSQIFKNRLKETLIGRFPRIYHGGSNKGIGGPVVKLNRMNRFFPDTPFDYNIIYNVSARIPPDVCSAAKKRGVRIVAHVNSMYHPAYQKNYLAMNAPIAEVFNLADHIVYGSEFARQGAERYLGKVQTPYTIIYNALDMHQFKPVPQESAGRFCVICSGIHRLTHRIIPLIKAMVLVQKSFPEAKLLLAGPFRPPETEHHCSKETVLNEIKESGLGDVEFIDSYTQAEAPLIYAQADIAVNLKHMDWTPNTAIEAMACGLPIVHAGNGGMIELTGEAGVSMDIPSDWDRIQTPDSNLLADKLIFAYQNRKALGQKARRIAEERYGMDIWVKAHQKIFSDIL